MQTASWNFTKLSINSKNWCWTRRAFPHQISLAFACLLTNFTKYKSMQISEISDWPPKGIWTALARKPPPGPFPGAANSHMPHLYGDRETYKKKRKMMIMIHHDTSLMIRYYCCHNKLTRSDLAPKPTACAIGGVPASKRAGTSA